MENPALWLKSAGSFLDFLGMMCVCIGIGSLVLVFSEHDNKVCTTEKEVVCK